MQRSAAVLATVALTATLSAGADEKGDALAARVSAASLAAKTLQADLAYTFQVGERRGGYNGSLRMMKPNLAHFRTTGQPNATTFASDGKSVFQVMEGPKEYLKMPVGARGQNLPIGGPASPTQVFFDPDTALRGERRHAGTEKVEGKEYEVLEITTPQPPQLRRFFVAPGGIVEGTEARLKQEQGEVVLRTWLKNLKLDAPLKAELVAYTPPAGFRRYEPPNFEAKLIPVGQAAPDFNLPQPGGGQLALSDTLKTKKAVPCNFWFYN